MEYLPYLIAAGGLAILLGPSVLKHLPWPSSGDPRKVLIDHLLAVRDAVQSDAAGCKAIDECLLPMIMKGIKRE